MGRQGALAFVQIPKRADERLIDTIAALAIRTGISPRELLETPGDIFARMVELVNESLA